jgi:hypothetical protein
MFSRCLTRLPWGAALLVVIPVPLFAQPVPPEFGPRTYVRGTGAPVAVTETVTPCNTERPFTLRVENGAERRPRVSSGVITLNGAEVVHQRDFDQRVTLIERPITLRPVNILAVRLAGQPGGAVAISIVSNTGCLGIAITAPPGGEAVPAGRLVVRGTVRGASDVGVTVNGFPAVIQGETFAATIPVAPVVTELVAVARTAEGATAETRQALTVTDAPESPLVFRAIPAAGAGALITRFSLNSSVAIGSLALDLEGTGTTAFEGATLDGQTFTYGSPGLYFPTVTVTDSRGVTYTATGLVQVFDRAGFDAQLQRRWTGMKDALRRGDVSRALDAVAVPARDRYRALLTALTLPLSDIDRVLTDIELVDMDEFQAEYEMVRLDNGIAISHFILFVRDDDGVWRLRFF